MVVLNVSKPRNGLGAGTFCPVTKLQQQLWTVYTRVHSNFSDPIATAPLMVVHRWKEAEIFPAQTVPCTSTKLIIIVYSQLYKPSTK